MSVQHYSMWADIRLADAYDLIDLVLRDLRPAHEAMLIDLLRMVEEADNAIGETDCCDAGKVWNNADPTSGMWVPCETHGGDL